MPDSNLRVLQAVLNVFYANQASYQGKYPFSVMEDWQNLNISGRSEKSLKDHFDRFSSGLIAHKSVKVASNTVASQGATLSQLVQRLPDSLQSYVDTALTSLDTAYTYLPSQARGYIDQAARYTTLESPQALAATALVLVVASVGMTSRWGLPSWGERLSPFGSRSSVPNVTEDDFSYITSQDLADTRQGYGATQRGANTSDEDDVLVCRHGNALYSLTFPAYSIGDGKLEVQDLRARVAETLGVKKPQHIKLLYKGRNLRDDHTPCRNYNLKNQSEVMASVEIPADDSEDSEEDASAGGSSSKKKRVRKSKKKGKRIDPNLSPGTPGGSGTSRHASPAPPPSGPRTAKEKLSEISSNFNTQILPLCIKYTANPPTDPKKRHMEKGMLEETIMGQVMLKADAVEVEGDEEARQMRKELIKTVQGVLNSLDVAGAS